MAEASGSGALSPRHAARKLLHRARGDSGDAAVPVPPPQAGPRANAPGGMAALRAWLAVRPLLGSATAPRELAKLKAGEMLFVAALLAALASVSAQSVVMLSEEGCLAHKGKPDCALASYRVKQAGVHLGDALHWVMAAMLLPLARGSVVSRATGLGFDRLVRWHRWLAQALVVLTVVHGACFFWNWIESGKLLVKLAKRKKYMGLVAFAALAIVVYTARDAARRASYGAFYMAHMASVPLLLLAVLLHYKPYDLLAKAAIPAALLLLDKALRWRRSRGHWTVNSARVVGRATVRLELTNPDARGAGDAKGAPRQATWVYLTLPALTGRVPRPREPNVAHPITTYAFDARHIVVYIGAAESDRPSSWSRRVLEAARADQLAGGEAIIDGPYGGLELPFPLAAYGAVVIAAGGVGITPLLPLAVRLSAQGGASPPATLLWVVRDAALVLELADELKRARGKRLSVVVHLTGGGDLEALRQLAPDVDVRAGRPDLAAAVTQASWALPSRTLAATGPGRLLAALVCGPQGLEDAFLAAVGAAKCGAHVHAETFHF